MNRANFGNIITNAMQVENVSATTAARFLGDLTSSINNLSFKEKKEIGEMRANQVKEELETYKSGGKSAFQHLTPEEQGAYRQKQAEDIRKYTLGSDSYDESNVSIDELMKDNSNQIQYIKTKSTNDLDWVKNWGERNLKRNILTRTAIDEFNEYVERK